MAPDPADIMARTIYGEDRGGGREGMEAVASVILNRAAHPRWWGTDIASVCQKPYQFSCWNADDPNRAKIEAATGADPMFTLALLIAERAIDGKLIDRTDGADSYYAFGTPEPDWAKGLTPTALIGGQRFYRVELPPPGTAPAIV